MNQGTHTMLVALSAFSFLRPAERRWASHLGFWLDPVALAGNDGFSAHELNGIRKTIMDNRTAIMEAWNEHCGE